MELLAAMAIALMAKSWLEPYCERISVAGSIRRRKADVGDIELVVIPKTDIEYDLFGEPVTGRFRSLLDDRSLYANLGIIHKFGQRYVQVELNEGINLDLFIVMPPAQWGVIYTLRTGPPEFSTWLVTSRSKGGAMHNGWRSEDGRIWDGQVTLNFPEEVDFLTWLNLGWIEPGERAARWNLFRRDYRG